MSIRRRMKRAAELGRSGPPPPRIAYGHEIVYTPIRDPWHDALPPAAKAAIPRLHGVINGSGEGLRSAIRELEALVDRHPQAPVFYNFLNVAYSRAGEEERRRTIIARCRAALPDYLFGMISQAELLLEGEDYEAFRELWGGRFDLRELYPDRTRFHVSEVAGFYGIIGIYHHETGNDAEARRLSRMLMDVAPDEAAAKALYACVHRNAINQLLEMLDPKNIAKLLELHPEDEARLPS
jgi:hypothetical protein